MSKYEKLKPQYGKERWARFVALRDAGFNRTESRELSRQDIKSHEVIISMMSQRRRMVKSFRRTAREQGWKGGTRAYHWNKKLRDWYIKRGYTSLPHGKRRRKAKGGESDVRVWYRDVLNRLAAKADMKPTDYDKAQREKGYIPRKHRGKVSRQRARAKERARSHRGIMPKATQRTTHKRRSQSLADYEAGRGR